MKVKDLISTLQKQDPEKDIHTEQSRLTPYFIAYIETKQPHFLKTIQPYFDAVKDGSKTFEHRRNDKNFEVGDTVCLREYDMMHNSYSGEEIWVIITFVLEDRAGLDDRFCIFSFEKLNDHGS